MSIEDDIAFLERVPTLRLLGRTALRILAIGAESRYVDEGEILFHAGEPADGAFVVQEGSLTLSATSAAPASVVGPGALLGELALLIASDRPVTATALEPSTVIRIPRAMFRKMLEGYPEAAEKLREQMSGRATTALAEIYAVRKAIEGGG